jgi:hypothetical protein
MPLAVHGAEAEYASGRAWCRGRLCLWPCLAPRPIMPLAVPGAEAEYAHDRAWRRRGYAPNLDLEHGRCRSWRQPASLAIA